MNGSARGISTWRHELVHQPFRQRLSWMPNLAAAALGVTLCVTLAFALANDWRMERIQQGSYPLMQSARSVNETLIALDAALRDVARSADSTGSLLGAADSLSRVAQAQLKDLVTNPIVDEAAASALLFRFDAYFLAARDAAVDMARNGNTLYAADGSLV